MRDELLNQSANNIELGFILAAAAVGVRLFIAGVFLLGAAHKFTNRLEFQGIVGQYRLLPSGHESFAATLVIGLELLAGLLLLFLPTLGSALAAVLLAGYALAIGINISRGRQHIDCGCGGESTPLSPALVWRNLLMLALLACIPLSQLITPTDLASEISSGQTTALLGIVFGLGLSALYLCYNQLQTNAGIYRRLWLGERIG